MQRLPVATLREVDAFTRELDCLPQPPPRRLQHRELAQRVEHDVVETGLSRERHRFVQASLGSGRGARGDVDGAEIRQDDRLARSFPNGRGERADDRLRLELTSALEDSPVVPLEPRDREHERRGDDGQGVAPVRSRALQAALGDLEDPLRLAAIAEEEVRGGHPTCEARPAFQLRFRRLGDRVAVARGDAEDDDVPRFGRQLVGEIPVLARDRMAEGGLRVTVSPRPVRGAAVQRPQLLRLHLCQAREQEVAEQRVVPVRRALTGLAGDEEVRRLQLAQNARRVRVAAQLDGQVRREALRDCGAQHEPTPGFRKTVEDLVQQVVGDGTLVPGKPLHEAALVLLGLEGERSEPNPGRPPFGALAERADVLVFEELRQGAEHVAALRRREREIAGTHLRELAGDPQALDPKRGIRSRRDDEPKLCR